MTAMETFEIFLAAVPGLEAAVRAEARELGFAGARLVTGGVAFEGGWPDVWRANLVLRGPSRILARVASFRAMHLAQLDRRARRVDWTALLRRDVPVKIEATCRASRIYHSGAAASRVARAITESTGAPVAEEAEVVVKVRIDDDLCTIAVDTSGELLHRRGHKQAVAKAPMRETMAAMLLRMCNYSGAEPVLDPMCGSGTFVIEAAETAAGLAPGRTRSFAFERLAPFDAEAWHAMREAARPKAEPRVRFHGRDRDEGAIRMSRANAERAGVDGITEFRVAAVEQLTVPEGPPGLVIVNPPYGERIGDRGELVQVYRALGASLMRGGFTGWRVGIVTSDGELARATRLPIGGPSPTILHGGTRIALYRTWPLP
jgi:putative N6-adenine-specific DNA methylase